MRFSGDKVGSFLTSCAFLLVAVLYVVSLEPVTCSSINPPANQSRNINNLTKSERGRTLKVTMNVTGLTPEQIRNALKVLRQETICNRRRARGKPLPAYCFDTTTTTESVTPAMESTLELTTSAGPTSAPVDPVTTDEVEATTSEVVSTTTTTTTPPPPPLPEEARRRRNAVGKDSISDQNLQSHILFAPDSHFNGKRKRRAASSATETDCDELAFADAGQNVTEDGALEIYIFQPDDCGENDTSIEELEEAANATKFNGRFETLTGATIIGIERYNDPYSTYITPEGTAAVTEATFTTEETTTTKAILTAEETTTTKAILTAEETTTTKAILTTEETTTTKAILTAEETTITTAILTTTADSIVTTSYTTYLTKDETTTAADILTTTEDYTVEVSNSTLPPTNTPLVNYKTWLPILIVSSVLLIIRILLHCYQKGKKQRRRRRPQVDPTEPLNYSPNQAQTTPSEAANGPRPKTHSNGPGPREVDADAGFLIPMDQF